MKYIYKKFPRPYGVILGYIRTLLHPFKIILFHLGFKVFFSGKGQDKWVIDILGEEGGGFFVDLAAASGVKESNTYILEKRYGWSGICIEPNPKYFKELAKARGCIVTRDVIASEDGKSFEFIFNNDIGGLIGPSFDNNYDKRAKLIKTCRDLGRVITIKSKTLHSILDHFKAPPVIDYLSLDIEGAEYEALCNFPFDRYQFRLITIERPSKETCDLLESKGYKFVKNFRVDSFWVHSDVTGVLTQQVEYLDRKSW